jgi:hypothetical protein
MPMGIDLNQAGKDAGGTLGLLYDGVSSIANPLWQVFARIFPWGQLGPTTNVFYSLEEGALSARVAPRTVTAPRRHASICCRMYSSVH